MANCDKQFGEYHLEISIPQPKKDRMSTSKSGLRKNIREHFKEHHPEYVPKFYIQGSAAKKMNTGIRTKDDICDLDDGVYFFREPDVTATTLQSWVWDAVIGYTDTDPEHRKKCIRSIFTKDYEIDHPVYYKVNGQPYRIAVKDVGFEDSDAKAMIDWFHEKKDNSGMLIRTVKYHKGWADNIRNKMPSGLALSILACNAKANIVYNERDDITLRDTLREIKKTLDAAFACVVPVAPYDDLFKDYDKTRRDNFMNALSNFLDDADAALKEPNELKATKLWRKHLGDRFPLGEDTVKTDIRNAAVARGAGTSNPYAE